MEDLIKQAFLQVDVLGPHVQEGHYDLIGPDGEIILPSVWEKVVQPDWAITMTMWPMDKLPRSDLRYPDTEYPGSSTHGNASRHPPDRSSSGYRAARWYSASRMGPHGPTSDGRSRAQHYQRRTDGRQEALVQEEGARARCVGCLLCWKARVQEEVSLIRGCDDAGS